MAGTVQPGIFTADGALVPVHGGPWIIGQPALVRLAHTGQLATVQTTSRWTGTTWAPVRPS
jgi:hypothetical protein